MTPAMPSRRLLLAAAAAWALPAHASETPPPEVAAELPSARLQGSGRLRVFGFQVYDARLWSPSALSPAQWPGAPLALELQYLRKLDGQAIADILSDRFRDGDTTRRADTF